MKRSVIGFSVKAILFLLLVALLPVAGALAAPTTSDQAQAVVMNWLGTEASPLRSPMGGQIREVQTFTDSAGNPAYYVVCLNPSGLVFLPADDLVEPIVGFVSGATTYDPSPSNPLGRLISGDIPGRVLQARALAAQAPAAKAPLTNANTLSAAQQKWEQLMNPSPASKAPGLGAPTVSDVRVAPFIQTNWGETTADGSQPTPPTPNSLPCYNYFTPPYTPGGPVQYLNYPTGSASTAQLMRFWQYPTGRVDPGMYTITVNGGESCWPLRGGDGLGGPYDWANMVLDPSNPIASDVQRRAIGSLTHDIDLSVNMDYEWSYDGKAIYTGTNKYRMSDVAKALVATFKYGNAMAGGNAGDNIPCTNRNAMINPNLDAGYPVVLSITSTGGGVFLDTVCDGYGYDYNSIYHHLHIGYGLDAWFNLPLVYLSTTDKKYQFNILTDIVYNVFPSGAGEIIAGRVTDSNGNPLSGVAVSATSGGKTYNALAPTTASGGYAIPKVPSNAVFVVSASLTGYAFQPQKVTTGASVTTTTTTGNVWGVDLSPITLNQALDNAKLSFTTGGAVNWAPVTDVWHHGGSSARSGTIGDSQTSWLQTTVTGPGLMCFWFKVSSETANDWFRFYLDDTKLVGQGSGEIDWTRATIVIPPGTHTVRWSYEKNASGSSGSDCAWVDQVVFPYVAVAGALEVLLIH